MFAMSVSAKIDGDVVVLVSAKIDGDVVVLVSAKIDGDVVVLVSAKFAVSEAEITVPIDDLYIMKKHLEVPTIDIKQCDSYSTVFSPHSQQSSLLLVLKY